MVTDSLRMRRELESAVSLTRVLALDGHRQPSLEDLWSRLVHAAQRLGFKSVKFTLPDQQVRSAECGAHQVRSAECGVRNCETPGHQARNGASSHQPPAATKSDEGGSTINYQLPTGHQLPAINHQLSTGPWTVYCGRAGVLEFRAPAHVADAAQAGDSCPFEILSELLAEGWLKANTAWHDAQPARAQLPAASFQLRFLPVPPGFWNLTSSFRREPLEREL